MFNSHFPRYILMAMLGLSFVFAANATELVIGQVASISGVDSGQNKAYCLGMQLAVKIANERGGVNGYTLKLVSKDDEGDPERTLSVTRDLLLNDRPLILAGYSGGNNVTSLLDSGILDRERITLLGYRAPEIRPDAPRIYSIRAGTSDEINKVLLHLSTVGISKAALLYEDGPGALNLKAAVNAASLSAKVQMLAKESYPSGTTDAGPAAIKLASLNLTAIVIVATSPAAANFIKEYRNAGGAAQLFATSGVDVEQLTSHLNEKQMQGVIISQTLPNPYKNTTRLSREFNLEVAKIKNSKPSISYSMLEGYVTGRIIVEVLRRTGAKPSREAVAAALDSMSDFDLGGYFINFSPSKHSGSNFVELSIITSERRIRQ